jgi:hypothetical protein
MGECGVSQCRPDPRRLCRRGHKYTRDRHGASVVLRWLYPSITLLGCRVYGVVGLTLPRLSQWQRSVFVSLALAGIVCASKYVDDEQTCILVALACYSFVAEILFSSRG